jgi:hypothetical protein
MTDFAHCFERVSSSPSGKSLKLLGASNSSASDLPDWKETPSLEDFFGDIVKIACSVFCNVNPLESVKEVRIVCRGM